MNVIFLGPPGAGKGTQAKLIEDRYGLKQLSSGDMLRSAVAAGTEVGKQAKSFMDQGALVPNEVVAGVVLEAIDGMRGTKGIILDGFPRTVQQAEALDVNLSQSGGQIDLVLVLNVDNEKLVQRIVGRFTCAKCGEGFHDTFKQPAVAGVCDRCGGTEFKRRADDNEETVRNRLAVYHAETSPLVEYYRKTGKLRELNGDQPIADVTRAVEQAFSERPVA
jgi:adenylate kinase